MYAIAYVMTAYVMTAARAPGKDRPLLTISRYNLRIAGRHVMIAELDACQGAGEGPPPSNCVEVEDRDGDEREDIEGVVAYEKQHRTL